MLLNILQWTGQSLSPGAVASRSPVINTGLAGVSSKIDRIPVPGVYLAGVPKEHGRGELK